MKKETLKRLIDSGLSYESIGRIYNITGTAIKKCALRFGIKLSPRRRINPNETFGKLRLSNRICPFCGKEFHPKYKEQKFCSKKCGIMGQKRRTKKEKPVWDGVEKKNMWHYGNVVKNHDYCYAKCVEHPFATSTGYVYLHRLVMENFLGRLLRKDEVVHHKDGNKQNNNIENLLILNPSQHSKIHTKDRIAKIKLTSHRNPARGKQLPQGHFDEEQIKEIRELAKSKSFSRVDIANKYGVTKSAIQQIIQRRTYKWVV